MKPFKKIDAQDIAVLRTFVPEDRFFVEDQIHPDYAHDEMMIYGKQEPEVVIQIKNAEEACDKAGKGYFVFDESGKIVYPIIETKSEFGYVPRQTQQVAAGYGQRYADDSDRSRGVPDRWKGCPQLR